MAMNKQRRTSNINNIVTYDTLGNVTVPASLTQGLAFSALLKADNTGKIISASGADYQQPISLTTIGNSGPSTFISNTLNIPSYTLAGLGGLSSSRTLTINSVSYDLTTDRTWSISLDSVTDVNAVTTNKITVGGIYITGMTAGTGALYYTGNRLTLANYNAGGTIYFEVNGGNYTMVLNSDLSVQMLGYTSNGFLKTSASNGTLVVDTTSYVAATRNLTINGVTYDLSADRTWTISASGTNIYNSDGTLTGNRTLSLSTYSLTFSGTIPVKIFPNGNMSIGSSSDNGAALNVVGRAMFGDFSSQFIGVIAYQASSTTRLAIFNGKIWHTNGADGSIWIDAGGTNQAGSQPFKLYTEEYAGTGIKFPLCLQGNGYETIFGQDTITTNASSLVTMVSTTKGFLPPRMTAAQRAAISSPATGLIVYQTDGSFGLYVKNAAAWQLLGSGGGGGGTGTVTSVSVVTANGFSGTVLNDTTTPAITISTTVTGVLKGNGTSISAATAGTDYQGPITLTTTGTSGAATLVGNTLNVPIYSSTATSGTYTPTITNNYNCTIDTIFKAQYLRTGDIITVSGLISITGTSATNAYGFDMSIPVSVSIGNNTWAAGSCIASPAGVTTGTSATSGYIQGITSSSNVYVGMEKTNNSGTSLIHAFHFTYRLIA